MGMIRAQLPANQHLAQSTSTWGRLVAAADTAVIAIHGRERDATDILDVCSRIGRAEFAHLAPQAANGSWYPHGFMAPFQNNEPWLSWTFERLDVLLRQLMQHGIASERVVLLGFSQGACIVAEYAMRNPRRYAALLIFTGGVIGPAGVARPQGDFAGTPVLISGSTRDRWVPCTRMQDTARLFTDRGAQVAEHYYDRGEHEVSDAEIASAREVLRLVT